jgi:hypothetical protein
VPRMKCQIPGCKWTSRKSRVNLHKAKVHGWAAQEGKIWNFLTEMQSSGVMGKPQHKYSRRIANM